MPGNKRPRQIQRTTSMSQLGASQGFYGGTSIPPRGHSCPPKQEFFHGSMEPCLEAEDLESSVEEHANTMVVDSSAEESLFASRTLQPPRLQGANLGYEAPANMSAHQWSYLPHYQSKDSAIPSLSHRRLDANRSSQPIHFLDICHLCSKLLGHGRDVFIYRGDKAFCSVECRHLQIMADERREKGVLTGAKDGSITMQANDSPNANHVETVAAA